MRQFILICITFLSFSVLSAQNTPLQLRLYGEGGYYFQTTDDSPSLNTKDGSATGLGFLMTIPTYRKWSIVPGLGYRYLYNETSTTAYYNPVDGGEFGSVDIPAKIVSYPKHYLLIPLKLRYQTNHKLFLESGFEAAWLLNYKHNSPKTGFNWCLGLGMAFGKTELSLQYNQGLSEQTIDKRGSWSQQTDLKNNSLSIRVSYPLWMKK